MKEEERTLEEIEKEQEREIIQAIKEDRFYDWISAHYWELSNDLQIALLKEFVYIQETRGDENRQGDKWELIENIKERF